MLFGECCSNGTKKLKLVLFWFWLNRHKWYSKIVQCNTKWKIKWRRFKYIFTQLSSDSGSLVEIFIFNIIVTWPLQHKFDCTLHYTIISGHPYLFSVQGIGQQVESLHWVTERSVWNLLDLSRMWNASQSCLM